MSVQLARIERQKKTEMDKTMEEEMEERRAKVTNESGRRQMRHAGGAKGG
jgi:hypothetical protein